LGAQSLERGRCTDQTVQGVGRGRRASTRHRHLRGEAWLNEWCVADAAENGRNRLKHG
jgi:hypothetical protein